MIEEVIPHGRKNSLFPQKQGKNEGFCHFWGLKFQDFVAVIAMKAKWITCQ
jgi:hypothetical protein